MVVLMSLLILSPVTLLGLFLLMNFFSWLCITRSSTVAGGSVKSLAALHVSGNFLAYFFQCSFTGLR